MNREFRNLVKRTCPKGTLSPLAKVLKDLPGRLPTMEQGQLITNALPGIRQKLESRSAPALDGWLNSKAKRHDQCEGLFVALGGTLDHPNAQNLLKRIREAVENIKLDAIVNFEHLRHATPEALHALLDGETLKTIMPHAKGALPEVQNHFCSIAGRSTAP